MKKLIALFNGNIVEIIEDTGRYFYTNSKGNKQELKREQFIFIA